MLLRMGRQFPPFHKLRKLPSSISIICTQRHPYPIRNILLSFSNTSSNFIWFAWSDMSIDHHAWEASPTHHFLLLPPKRLNPPLLVGLDPFLFAMYLTGSFPKSTLIESNPSYPSSSPPPKEVSWETPTN
jgi:hypothetical protein